MVELDVVLDILTSVSIIIGVFYYMMTLQNSNRTQQLTLKAQEQATETRQAQLFMQIYDKWIGPEYSGAWKTVRSFEYKDYNHFKAFWDTYAKENSPEVQAMAWIIGFYEGLGVLVKEGLVNIRMIALLMTMSTTQFFEKHLPYVDRFRDETGAEGFASETQYLYEELIKYIKENPDFRSKK